MTYKYLHMVDGVEIRRLRPEDVDGAVALNAEAGWNQVAADWRFMLGFGSGLAVDSPEGRLVASGMVLPCGERFAWIAMILVTEKWRRRGLATAIMAQAIETCRERGWIAGLDATEAGRPVYLPLGFRDIYGLSRWEARSPTARRPPPASASGTWSRSRRRTCPPSPTTMRPGTAAGAKGSSPTSRAGRRTSPSSSPRTAGCAAFCLPGTGASRPQLGPLVAEDEAAARALLAAGLVAARGPVFLDAGDHHGWLADWLPRLGFGRQRGYVRMLLGRSEPLDDPRRMVLIAGPEFG